MWRYKDLIPKLIPGVAGDLLKGLLGDLRKLAKSLAAETLIPSLTRVVTKGVDGLVKIFATQLVHADAKKMVQGTIGVFQAQTNQFCDSLRVYAQAALDVEAARAAKVPESQIDTLRKTREVLRLDVRSELSDMLAVITGGVPDD